MLLTLGYGEPLHGGELVAPAAYPWIWESLCMAGNWWLLLLTLGYGEPLHGGELVAPGGVGDLQGADRLVAADHLPAHTLDTIQ